MAPKKGGKIGHFGAFFGMLTSKMEESLSNLNATLACPLPLCVLSLEEKGAKLSSVGDFHDIRNLYMSVGCAALAGNFPAKKKTCAIAP